MPERSVEDIGKEIAAERRALVQDMATLRFRLRWIALVPLVAVLVRPKGGKIGVWAGLKILRKLI